MWRDPPRPGGKGTDQPGQREARWCDTANMMVTGPGGYRFGDYWKLGLPMLILFFVVAVFLVPVIWSF